MVAVVDKCCEPVRGPQGDPLIPTSASHRGSVLLHVIVHACSPVTDVNDRRSKKYKGSNEGLLSSDSRAVMSKVLSIKRGVGQRIVITALQVCPLCCKSRADISKVPRAVGQSLASQNPHKGVN